MSQPVAVSATLNDAAAQSPRSQLIDLLTVLAFTGVISAFAFLRPLDLQDEQLIVVYADQIREGRFPHVDFFTVYGPGTFALVALGFVLGAATEMERVIGLAYHLSLVAGTMLLARPRGRRPALLAGVICALAMVPLDLIAYAWLGGLALIVVELLVLTRGRSMRSAAVAGVVAGLVPFWRPEMLVIALLVAVPLVWGRQWKPFVAGLALGLLPLFGLLVWAGPPLWDNVVVSRLAANAQLDLASVSGAAVVGLVLTCTATAVVVMAAVRLRDRILTSMALLCLGVLPQTFQRLDVDHVAFSLCVTAPLAVMALWPTAGATATVPTKARMTCAVLVAGVLVLAIAPFVQRPITSTAAFSAGGHSMPVNPGAVDATRDLVHLVERTAPSGSRVFIGAKDMSRPTLSRVALYHVLPEYVPASYYLELPPGVAERAGSRLADDILSADVLVLTDVPADLSQRLFPNFPPGTQDANRAVSEYFCLVGTNPLGDVYRRCR